MLLILLSWIYTLILATISGVSINKVLKLEQVNPILVIFHGFFGITLFAGFWAITFAINWQLHCILIVLAILLTIRNKEELKSYIFRLKSIFLELNIFLKILLACITILILAQCASSPLLPDNESYYIQTILWLNDYGFVKGLSNLHLFLGQTSGWHILQSTFSLSFLYPNFNDLSGLCLLLGNFYAFTKLNAFFNKKENNAINLTFGFFPVFNIILFPFINSPSPDIAVYTIFLLIAYGFIMNYNACSKNGLLSLVLLTSFLLLIKITTIVCLLFPLVLYIKHFKNHKQHTFMVGCIYTIALTLLIIKNIIITGNAFYPFSGIENLKTSWTLPENIANYFSTYGNAYGYGITSETYKNSSMVALFKHWFLQSGIDGAFNKLMILLLLAFPFIIKKKAIKFIYGVAILQMLLLFLTSPQFRFYLPFFIILSLFILSQIIKKQNMVKSLLIMTVIACAGFIFIPIKVGQIETHSFAFKNFIVPHSNSQYPLVYKTETIQDSQIHIPTNIDFFWGTGNTPLPAVNEQQLNYFKTYFNVIPQQRSTNLKDGFILKTIEE